MVARLGVTKRARTVLVTPPSPQTRDGGPPRALTHRLPPPWEQGKPTVANVLPGEKRLRVLAALVDGNSERAVERMTEVNRETVGRYALTFGIAAEHLHNRIARDLSCSLIEVDEVW